MTVGGALSDGAAATDDEGVILKINKLCVVLLPRRYLPHSIPTTQHRPLPIAVDCRFHAAVLVDLVALSSPFLPQRHLVLPFPATAAALGVAERVERRVVSTAPLKLILKNRNRHPRLSLALPFLSPCGRNSARAQVARRQGHGTSDRGMREDDGDAMRCTSVHIRDRCHWPGCRTACDSPLHRLCVLSHGRPWRGGRANDTSHGAGT